MPIVRDYILDTLQVTERPSINISVRGGKCAKAEISKALLTKTINADLLLVITTEGTKDDSFVAYASPCQIHPYSGRPVVGRVNFNLAYLNTDFDVFFDQFGTIYHEITHVLGFSPSLFKYFINWRTNSRIGKENVLIQRQYGSNKMDLIATPEVKKFVQQHFNCNSLEGAPVENEGGAGSKGAHWEKVYFGSEYMVASTIINPVISGLTIALLKDTGWYQFNDSGRLSTQSNNGKSVKIEPMFWLKDYGCNIYKEQCPQAAHSCTTSGVAGCSFDQTFEGRCRGSGFSNGCKYNVASDFMTQDCRIENNTDGDQASFYETHGFGNRCFRANLTSNGKRKQGTMCLIPKCEGSPTSPTVSF